MAMNARAALGGWCNVDGNGASMAVACIRIPTDPTDCCTPTLVAPVWPIGVTSAHLPFFWVDNSP